MQPKSLCGMTTRNERRRSGDTNGGGRVWGEGHLEDDLEGSGRTLTWLRQGEEDEDRTLNHR